MSNFYAHHYYYYSSTIRIKLKLNVNENIFKCVRYTTKIKYRFKRVLYIFLLVRKVFIAKKFKQNILKFLKVF